MTVRQRKWLRHPAREIRPDPCPVDGHVESHDGVFNAAGGAFGDNGLEIVPCVHRRGWHLVEHDKDGPAS